MTFGMSKLGGLTAALEVAAVGDAAGFGLFCWAASLRLGIASSAGLHLAALLPNLDYPAYLLGPLEYEDSRSLGPQLPQSAECLPRSRTVQDWALRLTSRHHRCARCSPCAFPGEGGGEPAAGCGPRDRGAVMSKEKQPRCRDRR